jgi:hypothetical protein
VEIRAFIFNWRGHAERAHRLQRQIGAHIPTLVINSEEGLGEGRAGWVDLDDRAYFSAQWNEAVRRFDGDVLFHVQADATLDDFRPLLDRAVAVFARYPLGVYEPNVDYTSIIYDRRRLRAVEPDLLEVPLTDCTCWFVAGELLRRLPPVDLAVNRFGWGIAAAHAAMARRAGRLCLRDYAFTVVHPRARGYPSPVANAQRLAYTRSLGPTLAAEIELVYAAWRSHTRAARLAITPPSGVVNR